MKILSVQNYNAQNKKTNSFEGTNPEVKLVMDQITNGMMVVNPTVMKIKKEMLGFRPATNQVHIGKSEFIPSNITFNSSYEPYIPFYDNFFDSLVKEKSPLLKNAGAMNKFTEQVYSILESATDECDSVAAKKSLLLLKKVYTYLKSKRLLIVKDETFKGIDKMLSILG
jgi:hypothetical protein